MRDLGPAGPQQCMHGSQLRACAGPLLGLEFQQFVLVHALVLCIGEDATE